MTYTPSDIMTLICGAFIVAAVAMVAAEIILGIGLRQGKDSTAWGGMIVFIIVLLIGLYAVATI